jgi:predicted ATPase/DNA-binding CsgD family transcriptional regulator
MPIEHSSEQTIETGRAPGSSISQFRQVPLPFTPLIGRKHEVQEACILLRNPNVRLLTVTGAGGIGKTRLALQLAEDVQYEFADGYCFVPLAAITTPQQAVLTIAQTLGLRETRKRQPFEHLKTFLSEKHLLLVLDNFEQVLAAAPLLPELLSACPQLKMLVTSRAVLRVQGEYEFLVPPLPVPDLHHLPTPEVLMQYGAVALFMQRAQALQRDFRVTEENAGIIAAICARLDGLPLAIELAAAHSKLLPPRVLLSRLEKPLEVLTRGGPDVPVRQQTMRHTITWSYDLLSTEEQRLFRRLSVFVGGCTLEAAETVCTAPGDMTSPIMDVVASLLDKSLLQQVKQEDDEWRLMMLDMIREYGLERLAASGELASTRDAHANYYLELAEEAEPALHSIQQGRWQERLEREHENMQAALQWLLEHHEKEQVARFAGSLLRFWIKRGSLNEGLHWLEQALRGTEQDVSAPVRIKALFATGVLAGLLGNVDQATTRCQECLELCQGTGDSRNFVLTSWMLARLATEQGEYALAQAQAEEALEVARKAGDNLARAYALHRLGSIALALGEFEQARKQLEESLVAFTEIGDLFARVEVLRRLAEVFVAQGDEPRALTLLDEGISLASKVHDSWTMAGLLNLSGQVELRRGNATRAWSLLEEAQALQKSMGDYQGVALSDSLLARVASLKHDDTAARGFALQSVQVAMKVNDKRLLTTSLEGLAQVAADQEEHVWAARLGGAAEQAREVIGVPLTPVERASRERLIETIQNRLGKQTFAAMWIEGRSMTPEQALAAQDMSEATLLASSSSHEPVLTPPAGLTNREFEVLSLVVKGLTNAQIAEQLVIRPVTVNSYLRAIYSKLGVSSRLAAMRYAIDHNLLVH